MTEDDPKQKMRAFDDEVALTVAPFSVHPQLARELEKPGNEGLSDMLIGTGSLSARRQRDAESMNEVLSNTELIAAIDSVLALSISDSASDDLRAYKRQIEDGTIQTDDRKYVVDLCRRLIQQATSRHD